MKLVNEGLKAGDLEGVVEKRFSVDQYKSKMGDDKNILVLGFVVDGQAPAKGLERFAEVGYSSVLDADATPGSLEDGKHRVFVEFARTPEVIPQIISFLEGESKKILTPNNCRDIGIETAKLHTITEKLTIKRKNDLSIESWRKIFNSIKKECSKIHPNLQKIIEKNLLEIENNWPKKLPAGIIHADLFSDNIFFRNDKLTGFIDFYFSCYDFYAFEIAICLNALCFEGINENLSFNVTKAKKFIDGYSSIRKLSDAEKNSLKILSKGAAIRFLLTRVFDYLNVVKGAIVKIKDPIEYLKRLEFHDDVNNYKDYFF